MISGLFPVTCIIMLLYAGSSCWPIAVQEVPYPDSLDKYKLFAQFFLQGKVMREGERDQ